MKGKAKNIKQDYILGDEIGKGEFGSVRRCRSKATGEEFACKTFCKSEEAMKLLLKKLEAKHENAKLDDILAALVYREADLLQHLSGHPGIVSFKGVYGDDDSECFHLVMELCSGGDLLTQMRKVGRYSESQAASMLKELVLAIKHCHNKGVAHRDIKAENILLSASGSIKLSDFGLAAIISNGQKMSSYCGSPVYMAPEVLSGNYCQKVDIWSAGVLLYAFLFGVLPFEIEGDSREEIGEEYKKVNLEFSGEIWDSVSAPAQDLIRRMLSRDVSSRMTADQVLTHPWILSNAASVKDHDRSLVDEVSAAISGVRLAPKRRGRSR